MAEMQGYDLPGVEGLTSEQASESLVKPSVRTEGLLSLLFGVFVEWGYKNMVCIGQIFPT